MPRARRARGKPISAGAPGWRVRPAGGDYVRAGEAGALAEAIRWPGGSPTPPAGDYYSRRRWDRLLWAAITTDTREPAPAAGDDAGRHVAVYPQVGDIAIEYAWPGIMLRAHICAVARSNGLWCARRFGATGWPDGGGADRAAGIAARTTAGVFEPFASAGRRSVGPLATSSSIGAAGQAIGGTRRDSQEPETLRT